LKQEFNQLEELEKEIQGSTSPIVEETSNCKEETELSVHETINMLQSQDFEKDS